MQIKSVAIADLVFDPANARKHEAKNLDAIKGSLARFGQQKPIVVGSKGVIIAGNGTLAAARSLGWEKIDVVYTDLTGTDATAFAIADNRTSELAEWDVGVLSETLKSLQEMDFDMGSIGFDADDLAAMIATPEPPEGLTDPDAVPENVETRCKTGDLWVLGGHRLLCGDSTSQSDVDRLFGGETAELCFTSPPYADQRQYNGGKELSTEHLATFIRTAHGKVKLFAVNLGLSRKDGAINPYWDDYIAESNNCGLKLLSWNVWDRSGFGVSIGNQTAMFPIWHEWIFVFGEKSKDLNRTKENKSAGSKAGTNRNADGTTKAGSGVTAEFGKIGTVLKCGTADGNLHPAMFPVAFPEAYIEACSAPGEWVYEPFSGSGSTLIACEKTGRRCFGMEIDPKYCDVILARWEAFTGKVATLTAAEPERHG